MSSLPASGAPARPLPAHVAVKVSRNVIRAGSASRRFREGDARSLLTAYLALIRGLRDQRRDRTIELRSADIEALARYLGRPGSEVVECLAEAMGATRSQRATMLSLFGTGALVIGLAGSTAVGRAQSEPTGTFQPSVAVEAIAPQPAPPVQLPIVVDVATTTSAPAPTTTAAPATAPVVPLDTPAPAPSPTEPPTIIDPPRASATSAPAPAQPAAPNPAEKAPAATEPAEETADATPEPAPDDTVVTDIGTPPIPPTTEPAPDDTVVTDIGTPPIPPTTDSPAG